MKEVWEEHILPKGCKVASMQQCKVVLGAQACSCAWMEGSLEEGPQVLLLPMCALELGRAQQSVTGLLVWVRILLCCPSCSPRAYYRLCAVFRGRKCSKLPSDFPCSCSRSALFDLNSSMVWYFSIVKQCFNMAAMFISDFFWRQWLKMPLIYRPGFYCSFSYTFLVAFFCCFRTSKWHRACCIHLGIQFIL